MFQLMNKDWATQKRSVYSAVFALAIFYLTFVMNSKIVEDGVPETLIFVSMSGFTGFLVCIQSNFSTNEEDRRHNWMLASLPVARTTIVRGKYAMIGVWWAVTYALNLAFDLLLKLISGRALIGLSLPVSLLLSLCITVMLTSLSYPLYFRFGYRLARLISFIVIFSFFGIIFSLFAMMEPSGARQGMTKIGALMSEVGLLPTLALITIVIYIGSYLLSVHIFLHKDF